MMLPAVILGSYVGFKTVKHINNQTFSLFVKIFAAIAAGYLIFG
jgi:uncharacterized membrane protein YfcA